MIDATLAPAYLLGLCSIKNKTRLSECFIQSFALWRRVLAAGKFHAAFGVAFISGRNIEGVTRGGVH